MMEERIRYRKVRDLSAVFSATFKYIGQNFSPLFGSLFIVAVPFLLISGTLAVVMFKPPVLTPRDIVTPGYLGNFPWDTLALITLISLIGHSIFTVVMNKCVIEAEKLAGDEKLSINQVVKGLATDYIIFLGNLLILVIFTFLAFFVAAFIIYIIMNFLQGIFGTLFILFPVILLLLAALLITPVISNLYISALFICQRERINIFSAFGIVLNRLKGNFWNTWILGILALILFYMITFLASVPGMIIDPFNTGLINTDKSPSSNTMIILVCITTLVSVFARSLLYLLNIFHYGNLEEGLVGTSILEKIDKV